MILNMFEQKIFFVAAQLQKFFIGTVAFKDKIKQDDEAMQPLILHSFNFCCVSDRVQASQLSLCLSCRRGMIFFYKPCN